MKHLDAKKSENSESEQILQEINYYLQKEAKRLKKVPSLNHISNIVKRGIRKVSDLVQIVEAAEKIQRIYGGHSQISLDAQTALAAAYEEIKELKKAEELWEVVMNARESELGFANRLT